MSVALHVKPANQRVRIRGLRGLALVLLPLALFTRPAAGFDSAAFEMMEVAGVMLVVAAILGRFWAILYIGGRKNREVVQHGPYSLCRHPLYLFSTIGAAGLGLMLGSLALSLLFAGVAGMVLSATARREEAWLAQDLGPAWAVYAARVPRLWPRLSGYRSVDRLEISTGSLSGNFADALGFLMLIPLAELLEFVKVAELIPTVPVW